MIENPKKITPSRKWYLIAFLITVVGPIIGVLSIIHTLNAPAKIDFTLNHTAETQIEITKTGTYTLWAKPQHVEFDLNYEHDPVHGETYAIRHKATGELVPLQQTPPFPVVNWFKIQSSEVRIPIANVNFKDKGTYVTPMGAAPYVLSLSLGYPSISTIYQTIIWNIILILSTIIIGPFLAIGILILRNSAVRDDPVLDITPESQSANNALEAFCHASGYTCFMFPFGHIISPLFIWLFFKEQYPLVNEHGKAVLNFQLSMTIYYIVLIPFLFFLIGIPVMILLFIYHMFIMIIGIIYAVQGKLFRYPMSMRLIR